jgi:N-acetylglutamate synthase-like GNAT family acetyltransferase
MIPSGYVLIDNKNNNKFVGFISVEKNNAFKDKKLWLSNLFIVPNYRNKGIAKTFLENVCKIYEKQYNLSNIFIWIHDFSKLLYYDRLGFEIVGQKLYEGYDFTIMKKQLIPEKESPIQAVHVIGLFVIIIILYFIKKIFGFLFGSKKPIVISIEQ